MNVQNILLTQIQSEAINPAGKTVIELNQIKNILYLGMKGQINTDSLKDSRPEVNLYLAGQIDTFA